MLNDVIERTAQLGISLSFDQSVISFIADASSVSELGARPMRRAVTREIEDRLAIAILEGKVQTGENISAIVRNGTSVVEFIKTESASLISDSAK